eukprot:TRINITY_DN855_c1_g2_i7.p2 TRINITY_DN855_c1_g2~~TRINITY_DN855_c1_g2_i7.p2  ORF type:complete len:105 (-),score=2.71 TRINITY_DN855_c1_g2_i7:242-556(-)
MAPALSFHGVVRPTSGFPQVATASSTKDTEKQPEEEPEPKQPEKRGRYHVCSCGFSTGWSKKMAEHKAREEAGGFRQIVDPQGRLRRDPPWNDGQQNLESLHLA